MICTLWKKAEPVAYSAIGHLASLYANSLHKGERSADQNASPCSRRFDSVFRPFPPSLVASNAVRPNPTKITPYVRCQIEGTKTDANALAPCFLQHSIQRRVGIRVHAALNSIRPKQRAKPARIGGPG